MDPRRWVLGSVHCASIVAYADDSGLPVDPAGLRDGRRRAACMADTNTTLHRLTASSASGTVALSAKAVEERLRDQLEKGELTMGELRADYARYCE